MPSKKVEKTEKIADEDKIKAVFAKERVLADSSNLTRELYDKSRYGTVEGNKFQYSLNEALYLLERGKMIIMDGKKDMDLETFLKKANKVETNFWIRYSVFKDLRNRGYIVKTALKFGADFRVYDRGVKPGEDHAKWVVYPVYETDSLTWYEYAAKNRVAHSTRKRLLLGIVDEEGSVTYYECKWIRP
ncbi:MAG: tRNA-intron lyase [Nanoarchaeota archaeon]|nr:tRNA-intron lyase [Nanoarchaeota archaeon]MBU4242395.1 tRNA-intron lyase [Nanoarchaeota archaeon]MBU4351813.1 tRNA-intron lyase [Nanoarchaeota archaeon]MBU4456177.1 tRNA-intron lyase [Nanoarchaeota archaeon]MCG2719555.1 tRNA-intron lyase [Nanoarchaeota archaeon]